MNTKIVTTLVSSLLLPLVVNAGAVSSGGGAPPPPVFPPQYAYHCKVEYSYREVDKAGLREGTVSAETLFAYDSSQSSGFPGSGLDLDELNWKSEASSDSRALPIKVNPATQRVTLSFAKSGAEYKTELLVVNSMKSESGEHTLSSYDRETVDFETDKVIKAKANLEERNNWNGGQEPRGFLVRSTSLKVRCTRVK